MSRLALGAVAVMFALPACGTDYTRPTTVEYITEAVLAPSCAVAQCHSSFRRAGGYAFDTVAAARDSLVGIVTVDGLAQGDPSSSLVVTVLERSVDRMPYDQPLADADIELIRAWVEQGAPGAQCDPTLAAEQCLGDILYACGNDYSYGEVVQNCSNLIPNPGMRWVCRSTACTEVAQ